MGITVENSEGEAVNWWAETYPEFAEVPQLTDPLPILLPIPPTAPRRDRRSLFGPPRWCRLSVTLSTRPL